MQRGLQLWNGLCSSTLQLEQKPVVLRKLVKNFASLLGSFLFLLSLRIPFNKRLITPQLECECQCACHPLEVTWASSRGIWCSLLAFPGHQIRLWWTDVHSGQTLIFKWCPASSVGTAWVCKGINYIINFLKSRPSINAEKHLIRWDRAVFLPFLLVPQHLWNQDSFFLPLFQLLLPHPLPRLCFLQLR